MAIFFRLCRVVGPSIASTYGMQWYDMAVYGFPWRTIAWHIGRACHEMACHAMAWHGMTCHVACHGMPRHGIACLGMALACHAMGWHAMALPSIAFHCCPLLSIAVHCRPVPSIAAALLYNCRHAAALPSTAANCTRHCRRQSTAMDGRYAPKKATKVSMKAHLTLGGLAASKQAGPAFFQTRHTLRRRYPMPSGWLESVRYIQLACLVL